MPGVLDVGHVYAYPWAESPRVGFTFTCSRQPLSPPELLTDRLPDLCQDVRLEGVRQAVPTGHDLGQVLGKPVLFWYSS